MFFSPRPRSRPKCRVNEAARERDRLGLGKDSVAVAIVRVAETHFHGVDSQTISGSPVVEVLCRVAPVLHAFRPTVQVDSVL